PHLVLRLGADVSSWASLASRCMETRRCTSAATRTAESSTCSATNQFRPITPQ
ncbi:hypothetical protein KUCAC02_034130, partial [Chaenocephalus aceratus]